MSWLHSGFDFCALCYGLNTHSARSREATVEPCVEPGYNTEQIQALPSTYARGGIEAYVRPISGLGGGGGEKGGLRRRGEGAQYNVGG